MKAVFLGIMEGIVPIFSWLFSNKEEKKEVKHPANPALPKGLKPFKGAASKDMQLWAKGLVNDPKNYPMFKTERRNFGGRDVVARLEWHTWTIKDGKKQGGVYRGVTLYEPVPGTFGSEFGDDWCKEFSYFCDAPSEGDPSEIFDKEGGPGYLGKVTGVAAAYRDAGDPNFSGAVGMMARSRAGRAAAATPSRPSGGGGAVGMMARSRAGQTAAAATQQQQSAPVAASPAPVTPSAAPQYTEQVEYVQSAPAVSAPQQQQEQEQEEPQYEEEQYEESSVEGDSGFGAEWDNDFANEVDVQFGFWGPFKRPIRNIARPMARPVKRVQPKQPARSPFAQPSSMFAPIRRI